MCLNVKLLVRSLILVLAVAAVLLAAVSILPPSILRNIIAWWITRPPDPTPPPPTLLAPRGDLPAGPGGLSEWAQTSGAAFNPVGSGFFLRLDDGTVVAVTTSHSVGDIGDPGNSLERIAFGIAGQDGFIAEFGTLYGDPGAPRTGDDMTVDYVLLKTDQAVDPNLILTPDPRGRPQPGERVSLYSGLGGAGELPPVLPGTVQSADSIAVWVLMDDSVYPGGASGSPLISQHTGKVVGMAIATAPRGNRYMIAFHPIGSIVQKAQMATRFVTIIEYQR